MNHYHWLILTGEYPPQPGGVSDYTRLIARGLAEAGDRVEIWAPAIPQPDLPEPGIIVHRLPDHFGSRSLRALTRAFRELPPQTRVLVQYVPHAFGQAGMNVAFCFWLWRQSRRQHCIVMFHEVATPWGEGFRTLRHFRRHFLAAVTRFMARLAGRRARRVFLSIPGWENYLRPLLGRDRKLEWLPVPSTMPLQVDPARAAALRTHFLAAGHSRFLVGHFGTFGGHIADGLRMAVPAILTQHPDVTLLLIGRGGDAFADRLRREHPEIEPARLPATGALDPDAVAAHLAACDLLVQPYVDGISSRRTSGMASLALGLPVLTTRGHLTEPIWEPSGAVRLVGGFSEMAAAVGPLLDDPAERQRLSATAAALYRERFDLPRAIAMLREP